VGILSPSFVFLADSRVGLLIPFLLLFWGTGESLDVINAFFSLTVSVEGLLTATSDE
jgi:hypothetical protein